MNTAHTPSQGASVTPMKNLAVLARLLERLEHNSSGVDAGQYRAVVQRLAQGFATAEPEVVEAILEISPAAALVYENLHYDHAGLCRTPLDMAVAAETAAREAIAAAGRL